MSNSIFAFIQDKHLFLPETGIYCTQQMLGAESLWGAERLLAQRWSAERIATFATGRACLRILLQAVCRVPQEILIDRHNAPLLPPDLIGTVSHTEGLVGAVLASRQKVRSVALDIERLGAVHRELWDLLFTPTELAWLQTLAEAEADLLATALFSIKECFYKLQSPLTGVFLDFPEVEIRWEEARGFVLQVLKDFPERRHLPAETVLRASIWGRHCVSYAVLLHKS